MKYSISSFYKDFVKERIFKDFLKEGKIPTELEINERLEKAVQESDEFASPLLNTIDYKIEPGESSSAKKMNQIFKTIESDLSVCVSAVIEQESQISNLYDSTYSKLLGLQNKVDSIKQNVDKILFESKNTDSHEELFYEKFLSKDMVDEKLTTAFIDTKTKEVTLNFTEQYYVDIGSMVDSVDVTTEDNPRITASTDIGEMTISNILKNNNKVWMHQVSASEALPSVTLSVVFRIPSVSTEINKIVFEPYSVDLKTQVNIEVSYSNDGLNWMYLDGEYKKRLNQTTSLSFKSVKSEYWRIKFTKFGNDGFFSNFYVYNFGLKSLNFYGKKYDKISRLDLGYFYSKPIVFKNNVKTANLKVCHDCIATKIKTIPTGTKISYFLGPIYETQLPSILNGSLSAKDIYYYSMNLNDKDSATIDFLTTIEAPMLGGIKSKAEISYKDKGEYDYCLDFLPPNDYSKRDTTILRNELNQSLYDALGSEKRLNDNYLGWRFDGNYYSTYLLIEKNDGLEINLGSTQMFINNKKVQGRVLIPKGLNFIVTHRDNWKSLDLTTLPLESDQVVDQLYPYNHKYLIEGLGASLYGRNLNAIIDGKKLIDIIDKNEIYPRTQNKCWSFKMKELDFSSFVSKNKNELDVFCYKIDNTNQERIVVKSDPDLGLITNETFSIITKLHSAENIKGLIFKAILETTDNSVSPVLTEYLVKIK